MNIKTIILLGMAENLRLNLPRGKAGVAVPSKRFAGFRVATNIMLFLFFVIILVSGCGTDGNKYQVQSLSINPKTITLKTSETQIFSCEAVYGNSQTRLFTPTWSINDSSIGTIDAAGKFFAIKEGRVVINASYGTIFTTAEVIVGLSDYPKKYYIVRNMIVDDLYNEVVFRGVNIQDPAWLGADVNKVDLEKYFSALSSWEVKIIRIPVHPAAYKYYGSITYLKMLDNILNYAEKYNIYAIIDFHSIGFPPTGTYQDSKADNTPWKNESMYTYTNASIRSFWSDIANHYKNDDRVVFFELFNEPTENTVSKLSSWDAWKLFAEELIDIIRAIDPDSKIIVGGISYSYDLSYVNNNPINRDDIVYGTHPYPNQGISNGIAFGNLKQKYPVFATEFGFDPNAANEIHYKADLSYGNQLIDYLENNKISWTAWNFSTDWGPALLLDWNYGTTASGTLFKSKLIQLN